MPTVATPSVPTTTTTSMPQPPVTGGGMPGQIDQNAVGGGMFDPKQVSQQVPPSALGGSSGPFGGPSGAYQGTVPSTVAGAGDATQGVMQTQLGQIVEVLKGLVEQMTQLITMLMGQLNPGQDKLGGPSTPPSTTPPATTPPVDPSALAGAGGTPPLGGPPSMPDDSALGGGMGDPKQGDLGGSMGDPKQVTQDDTGLGGSTGKEQPKQEDPPAVPPVPAGGPPPGQVGGSNDDKDPGQVGQVGQTGGSVGQVDDVKQVTGGGNLEDGDVTMSNDDDMFAVTLKGDKGNSINFWGDPHVVANIDGTEYKFDIGYGAGSYTFANGAKISWDTFDVGDKLQNDWGDHKAGRDASYILRNFKIEGPNGEGIDTANTDDRKEMNDEKTILTTDQLREFAMWLKENNGGNYLDASVFKNPLRVPHGTSGGGNNPPPGGGNPPGGVPPLPPGL